MRPISFLSLLLASIIALPWSLAIADDAPPAPPAPPAREEAPPPVDSPPKYRPIISLPGFRFVVSKDVNDRWMAAWQGRRVLLRADGPAVPPGARVEPSPPPAPNAEPLPPGIVPVGELSARIARARAAGREQEAIALEAALDALKREEEPPDSMALIVRWSEGNILRAQSMTVDGHTLPPGRYAIVASELRARRLQATGTVVLATPLAPKRVGTVETVRFDSIDADGNRVIWFVEGFDLVRGTNVGGTVLLPRLAASTGPIVVVDGGTAGPPPGTPAPRPRLAAAIEDLRGEIRALRDEVRALRALLEATRSPK